MNQLSIDSITFSYEKASEIIIRDFSFVAEDGESIMVVGDNGCGKSTLGKLVCGLLNPVRGVIKINGLSPSRLKPKERIKLAYYITQVNQLQIVKSSLLGEIELAASVTGNKYDSGLYQKFNLPDDYNFNPFELTVNQAWRFSLFLSTIINPVVLYIDELPSAVNVYNKSSLATVVDKRKEAGLITFLSYQRKINYQFDKCLLFQSNKIINE